MVTAVKTINLTTHRFMKKKILHFKILHIITIPPYIIYHMKYIPIYNVIIFSPVDSSVLNNEQFSSRHFLYWQQNMSGGDPSCNLHS
jgi:hypothetical protein